MVKKRLNPGLKIKFTPFSGFLEVSKYKTPRGKLVKGDYALLRNPFRSFLRKPPRGASILLHTHPKIWPAFPSPSDLSKIVFDIQQGKYRTGVVSSTNFLGAETGRIFIKTTSKTLEVPKSKKEWENYERSLRKKMAQELTKSEKNRLADLETEFESATRLQMAKMIPKTLMEYNYIFSKALSRVYNLKIRIVPSKGYRYNKEKGRFEKSE